MLGRYIRVNICGGFRLQYTHFSGKSFDGFNQVILASSSLRKGLEGIFYHNASEYAKECILMQGISRYDLFRDYNDPCKYHFMEVHADRESFQANIHSKHFKIFVSRCEDILNEEVELVEYKSLYPPKVAWCVPPEAADHPTPPMGTPLTDICGLVVICVDLHVKPEFVDEFIDITSAHCASSLRCDSASESGGDIARMDFIQSAADHTFFKLFIHARGEDCLDSHRASELYKKWSERVNEMCSQPRRSSRLKSMFPRTEFMGHKA